MSVHRSWHNGGVITLPGESDIAQALRDAGARFAFVHGSRAADDTYRPDSDLDVAAWWGSAPPHAWDVVLPAHVDLVILDTAPLWLAGRIALHGRILFEDDRSARVTWQADTRRIWLDERPRLLHYQRLFREAVIAGDR